MKQAESISTAWRTANEELHDELEKLRAKQAADSISADLRIANKEEELEKLRAELQEPEKKPTASQVETAESLPSSAELQAEVTSLKKKLSKTISRAKARRKEQEGNFRKMAEAHETRMKEERKEAKVYWFWYHHYLF